MPQLTTEEEVFVPENILKNMFCNCSETVQINF